MWIIFTYKDNRYLLSNVAHQKCDGDPEYKLWEQVISCTKDDGRHCSRNVATPTRLFDESNCTIRQRADNFLPQLRELLR